MLVVCQACDAYIKDRTTFKDILAKSPEWDIKRADAVEAAAFESVKLAATTKLEFKILHAVYNIGDKSSQKSFIQSGENKYAKYQKFVKEQEVHPAVLALRNEMMK